MLLLAPNIREWLPPNHLIHHVSDLVDEMDLSAFDALHAGGATYLKSENRGQVADLCERGVFLAQDRQAIIWGRCHYRFKFPSLKEKS